MIEPSRSLEQRTADVLARLREDVDLWVASADAEGNAYLVPLSFVWDGAALTISTPRASRTARNLMRAEWARVALGLTRDVVIVEGTVETITIGTDPALEDAHADDDIRSIILTGEGKAFCAGGDFSQMTGGLPPSSE